MTDLYSDPRLGLGSEEPALKQMVPGEYLRSLGGDTVLVVLIQGASHLPFVWGRWARWWGWELGWLPDPRLFPSILDI